MAKWISVEEQLPQLPEKEPHADVYVIAYREGEGRTRPMIYARRLIRGKTVEKWLDAGGGETYRIPDYWQPMPEPPKRKNN